VQQFAVKIPINRVYAKTKKKKTLEELEILPICSKKRVCEKNVLEEIFEI
jgi:hypothetical protein